MARARGSYPRCHRFKSSRRYHSQEAEAIPPLGNIILRNCSRPAWATWPVGQVVKTPPFHGGNTSSSLVRVTKYGGVAQPVEHLLHTQGVTDSSSVVSTRKGHPSGCPFYFDLHRPEDGSPFRIFMLGTARPAKARTCFKLVHRDFAISELH